jgi:hypothetical protein
MSVFDLYLSPALLACYDNEPAGDPPAGDPPAGDPPAGGDKTFTQEQVNKFLAEDRRKTSAAHKAALEKTETTYKELLTNNQNLSAKERQALEENLAIVQGQLRTKEQQAAFEKKQLEETFQQKLTEKEKAAAEWESRYRDSTISRSLQDAAVTNDAFSPDQIVTILRPMTKLIEVVDEGTKKPTGFYRPVIEFPDKDPNTGETVTTTRTPEEAVKRMKELPEKYGNLFKSNVVSGIGSNSTAGLPAGSGGKIDVRKLTPAQYREIRAKNPELLGLRGR